MTNDHLDDLEAEGIHILREAVAERKNPVLLFSGGKDSAVVLRLAEKAFRPGRFPFPLMHVDTGHNFEEVITFRDAQVAKLGERLIVASVEESIRTGRVRMADPDGSRNAAQSVTLLDAIKTYGFDCCFGGARRDEEKARAKERVFSVRDRFGRWIPAISGPSSGTSGMHGCRRVGTYAYSRSVTGPNSMSGNTSTASKSRYRRFIDPICVMSSAALAESSP